MVAPSSYILDIHGPYFSGTCNDNAAVLGSEIEENNDSDPLLR